MDLSSMTDEQLVQVANAPISNAILGQESNNGKNSQTSVDGAIGQGQITPDTWVQYAKPGEKIDNPEDNLAVHHRIINDLSERYNGDPARIAVGYFSGPGNVAPPDSPTPYVKDTKDGNGKSVSSYVTDVNGRLPRQVADSGNVQTDAQIDKKDIDFSHYSDDDLAKIAGNSNAQESTQIANPSTEGRNIDPSLLGQWWDNTAEVAKNVATATGQAISEPYSQQNVPSSMKVADAAMKTLGKLGNAVGGTFNFLTSPGVGAMTTGVERSGIVPSSAQWIKENLVPNDPRFSANIPPEVQHQVEQGIGGDLNNAFLMALGAKGGDGNVVSKDLTAQLPPVPPAPGGNDVMSFLKDQSSGGGGPPGGSGGFPLPKLIVDNGSGSPNPLEHIFKPKEPPPQNLMATDKGEPLLVTRDSIPKAQEDIKPFLENDGINLNKVADQLHEAQKVNPNVTALDIMAKDEGGIPGGQNMVGLAKSIAQSPGQGRTLAGDMTGRGYTASQRVGTALDNALSKQGFYNVSNDALNRMQTDAPPAYAKAYSAAPVTNDRIAGLLKTPEIQAGILRGLKIQRIESAADNVPFNPHDYAITGFDEAGEPIISGVPNMRLLDAGKKGLDAMINDETNDLTGKKTEMGRALSKLKSSYIGELDNINPDYAAARQSYGDQASRLVALNKGRNFMNMDSEEIQKFMDDSSTSNAEKVAFSVGARRALQDKIDNSLETRNPINALWKPNLQKRLQPLFPDKQSFDSFAANMEHEKTMARVNDAVRGGSDTFLKTEFNKTPPSTIAGKLLRAGGNAMEPGLYVSKLGDIVDKALSKQAETMSQNSKTIIMRYLTTKDPALLRELAQKIGQKPEKPMIKSQVQKR